MIRKSVVAGLTALTLSFAGFAAAPAALAAENVVGGASYAKVKTTTKVSVSKKTYGSTSTATVTVNAAKGKATGTVTVKVGKKSYKKTLKNGKATVSLGKLSAGKHKVSVTYAGNTSFASSKGSAYASVAKKSAKVSFSSKLAKGKKAVVSVKVSNKASGKVKVTVSKGKFSTTKTVTIKAGKTAKVTLPKALKSKGKYSVKVSFSGSNFSAKTVKKSATAK